jgi:hypothetical protein
MLFTLCINIFGTSIGQFMHKVSHILLESQVGQFNHFNKISHFHYSHNKQNLPSSTELNHSHEHHQILDFMLTTFNLSNGHTPLPDFAGISLLIIIDGIINDTASLPLNLIHQKTKNAPTVLVFPFKSIFLKIPCPPPKLVV